VYIVSPINESNDDVFDINVLMQVGTRMQETVQCLQMIFIRKHLDTQITPCTSHTPYSKALKHTAREDSL